MSGKLMAILQLRKSGLKNFASPGLHYLLIMAEVRLNPNPFENGYILFLLQCAQRIWIKHLLKLNFGTIMCLFVELSLILFPQNRVAKYSSLSNTEDEEATS